MAAPTSSKPAAKWLNFFLLWYNCPARSPPIRPTTFGRSRAEVQYIDSSMSLSRCRPTSRLFALSSQRRQLAGGSRRTPRVLHSPVQSLDREARARGHSFGFQPKGEFFCSKACRRCRALVQKACAVLDVGRPPVNKSASAAAVAENKSGLGRRRIAAGRPPARRWPSP